MPGVAGGLKDRLGLARGEQVDHATGADHGRYSLPPPVVSDSPALPQQRSGEIHPDGPVLAGWFDFVAGQGPGDDLTGRYNITPKVVGQLPIADLAALIRMNGEVLYRSGTSSSFTGCEGRPSMPGLYAE